MTAPEKTTPSELDQLAAAAAQLDSDAEAAAAQPSAAEVQQAQSLAQDLLDTLKMLRGIGGPVCHWMTAEKFAKVWNDDRLKDIATAGAAIMERHGWTLMEIMGKYAPYVALIAAMGAPTLETIRAFKENQTVQAQQPPAAQNGTETGN